MSTDDSAADPSQSPGAPGDAPGGTISFCFETPSKVFGITFLDIARPGGTVDLYDSRGDLIETLDIPVVGAPGQGRLEINRDEVAVMDVTLTDAGAIDDLSYVSPAGDPLDTCYGLGYLGDIPTVDVPEDEPSWDSDPLDFDPA